MLEKPKLFLNLKEFWFVFIALFFLLLVRLSFIYEAYDAFRETPVYFTDVEVIQAYEKWNDDEYHTILKVYSPSLDISFFSRTKIRSDDISKKLRLKLFPSKTMSFFDYLGTGYISAQVKNIYPNKKSNKNALFRLVEAQHSSDLMVDFYEAIFFAEPLEQGLRREVSVLGISHLIALSGFHLAILSGVLFFLIRVFYRPFQQRFFPYRFDLFDIGFLVLLLLAWYVWFVGSPPSLLRSYAMMLVAWVLLVFGMELLSFFFLSTTVLVLLVLFPKLLLSLAFWFSVVGVFYIFLLLQYFSSLNKYLTTLLISFGIFILMLPIVHLIFPITSKLQLLSPLLSLLFSFFYPLSMLLHFFHIGDILDVGLLQLFSLKSEELLRLIPLKYGLFYLLLSFLAVYSKWIFYLLMVVALSFSVWLFSGFWV